MSDISALFRKNLDRTAMSTSRPSIGESSSGKKQSYERRKAPCKSIPKHKIRQERKPLAFNFKELAKRTVSK